MYNKMAKKNERTFFQTVQHSVSKKKFFGRQNRIFFFFCEFPASEHLFLYMTAKAAWSPLMLLRDLVTVLLPGNRT